MPISVLGKRLRRHWALGWLGLVLLVHLLLVLVLDRLTGRDAERLEQPGPLQVRLLTLPPQPVLPKPLPAPTKPSLPQPSPDPPASPQTPLTQGISIAEATGPDPGGSAAQAPPERPTPPPAPPPPPVRESLPRTGALAIQAFLGEYAFGQDPLGVGEIRLSFPDPDRYEIELRARARGWVAALVSGEVSFKSEGTLSPHGLKPSRYAQTTPFRGLTESLFDPERGARLKPDAAWTYLPAGLQDRLSVVFQLAFIAQTRPEQFGPGQRHVIPMATDREIKPLGFAVGDPEELVLPGGILVSALRVQSDPFEFRRQGRITLWLDPADRFYPVRIQYAEPSGRILDFIAIRNPLAP